MKTDLLLQLEQLNAQEDIGAIIPAADEISQKLYELLEREERELQQKEAANSVEEGEEKTAPDATSETEEAAEEEATPSALDLLRDSNAPFRAVITRYKDKRSAWKKKIREEELANLKQKETLLEELETLIKEEENIGKAYNRMGEIRELWNAIGHVPRDKFQETQANFGRLNEDFYYNINMYKELRQFDLKRNLEQKLELIARLDEIAKLETSQELEPEIRKVQAEWDQVGPTSREDWEEVKEAYWSKVKEIYTRIRGYYEDRRKSMAENLELKKALLEKTKVVAAQECEAHKDWESVTQELLTIQKEWKSIGFANRKDNEKIWAEFREVCNQFFDAKKEYYNDRNEVFAGSRDKKKALIDKAEALKDSTDWKDTADKLKRLQADWKRVGSAGPRFENKLWRRFRGACDHFFDSRTAHFAEQDKAYEGNLTSKLELIAKIEGHTLNEDTKEALASLRQFSADFNALGHVPMKEKEKVYTAYKAALDTHYAKLKMDSKDKEAMLLSVRLDQLKQSPNAERMLKLESEKVRGKIKDLNDEITQYENNLGFFANSKGAEKIIADVHQKIEVHRKTIEGLKAQLKQIRETAES